MSVNKLASLGAVVAESAELEKTTDMIIASLLRLNDKQYEVILKSQQLAAKLKVLKELGAQKLTTKRNKKVFGDLIDRLTSFNSNRNVIVHGVWGPVGGYKLSWLASGRPKNIGIQAKDAKARTFNAEKLDDLATKLWTGRSELFHFWMKHWVMGRARKKVGKVIVGF